MNRALQQLREEVFRRGEYERPTIELEFLDEVGLYEADEQERDGILKSYGLEPLRPLIAAHGLDGLQAALEQLESAPELKSLDELRALKCLSSSGTHSILDISRIAATSEGSGLYPLSEEQVRAVYGTAQPTREQIEAYGATEDLYERYEGFYLTVYRDGQPDAIYIEGCSGD